VVQVNYLVLERRPRIWLFEILDDEVGLRGFEKNPLSKVEGIEHLRVDSHCF
jgi:hypothetical protein